MQHLTLDPKATQPPTRNPTKPLPERLPEAKQVKVHPRQQVTDGVGVTDGGDGNNASIYFVGTATVIMFFSLSRHLSPMFLFDIGVDVD